jgi:hypothetical protein
LATEPDSPEVVNCLVLQSIPHLRVYNLVSLADAFHIGRLGAHGKDSTGDLSQERKLLRKENPPAKMRFVGTCCYLRGGNLLDIIHIVQALTNAILLDFHFRSPLTLPINKL